MNQGKANENAKLNIIQSDAFDPFNKELNIYNEATTSKWNKEERDIFKASTDLGLISNFRDLERSAGNSGNTTDSGEITEVSAFQDPYRMREKIISKKDLDAFRKNKKSGLAKFYKRQNALISSYLANIDEKVSKEDKEKEDRKVKIAVYGSFFANIFLFGIQLFAAISSKSLSLLATMVDALMDIIAGGILVYTSKMANKNHWLKYPTGKKRLETVGTIIFSTLMATLSTQLIIESVRTITSDKKEPPNLTPINLGMVGIAIIVKLLLFIYCSSLRSYSTVKTFMIDHRNDIALNSFGLLMGYLSLKVGWYMDPIGGICLALLILVSWSKEAYEHVRLIVGVSANSDFINRITYISLVHSTKIKYIDTVRAYHVGEFVYVEVDVVMDPETPLYTSHDVSEALQEKIEKVPGVARAFVHVDYDFRHSPEHHPKST
ncbi:hypothetical protein BB559_006020 [Furculomyces boomerangus]|uniref:Uncharacterized protein n=1 Tax=Furculomyces boomerangus TaxID=61424 RepID=A0A2T9Y1B8_9FUNG|nr:hypothetical protein BB559_006660 [Furculomyces boomerangus]PVU87524.1 hypothetical protein BB559_006020 [Furculomyces boomerangus]